MKIAVIIMGVLLLLGCTVLGALTTPKSKPIDIISEAKEQGCDIRSLSIDNKRGKTAMTCWPQVRISHDGI